MRLTILLLTAAACLWCQTPGTRGKSATLRVESPHLGFLGAGVVEVTPERAKALKMTEATGVEVTHVDDNSAAAKAGLKVGDVILEFNKEKIASPQQFVRAIAGSAPGSKVTITVWRETKRSLTATLGERPAMAMLTYGATPLPPDFEIIPVPAPTLGIDCETLTPQLAQYFGVDEGVLVRSVTPHSPAEKAGLKAGDVILKVAGMPVTDPREISFLLRTGRKPMTFSVMRNHQPLTLSVELALNFDPCLFGGDCGGSFWVQWPVR